ncbi:MAG: hypothetical protein LBS65_02575 [Desulfovibrio sp.]|jgi:hypothetical protein|nr:hypothetical protein [Desulfovibrio sp.]
MKKVLLFIVVAVAFGASACVTTRPIETISNVPVGNNLSKEAVARAITQGGAAQGWSMVRLNDNTIEGTLLQRQHTVVVTIPFTANSYSIIYKSSGNMKADPGTGEIHRSYNRWVRNLQKAIGLEMTRLGNTAQTTRTVK